MKQYIIKVSGKVLQDELLFEKLLKDVYKFILNGNICILIHGGGLALTEYCKESNIEAHFDTHGRRITSEEEMYAADMILSGAINTNIVRICTSLGIRAVGLSCVDHSILIGESLNDSFTGIVSKIDTSLLSLLTNQHILPILCSVGCTSKGKPLNINADDVALSIGKGMQSTHLVFITDIEGVKINSELQAKLTSSDIDKFIEEGQIRDGMVIKTQNAIQALHAGVGAVIIGDFQEEGDFEKLASNERGSKIVIC